jgi:hypothetical protein
MPEKTEKTLEEFKDVYAMIEKFYKNLPAKAKSWVDDNWGSIQQNMIEYIETSIMEVMKISHCDECDELCDYDEGTICGDCDHCSSCGCVCEEDTKIDRVLDERENMTMEERVRFGYGTETWDDREARAIKSECENIYCRGCNELIWNRRYDAQKRLLKLRSVFDGYVCDGCEGDSDSDSDSDECEDCLAKNPRCSCGLLLSEDDMRVWEKDKSKTPMCEGCLDELKNKDIQALLCETVKELVLKDQTVS